MLPLLILGGIGVLFVIGHSFASDEHDPTVPRKLTAKQQAEIAANPEARRGLGHFASSPPPPPGSIPAGKVQRITGQTLQRLRKATGGKDEKPIPPLDDPRRFRAIAAAARKAGKAHDALLADAKADSLNVLIRAEKRKRGIA